ncbi:putative quinol monooxygenase [Nocardia transvalensis]|uniref:putative quinol monooxygenase n=1 Tax=Nocardia transvalensis TaxID=37333 RepID=UPI0018952B93|nr:antibiotic biosynthesis monooxygenase family protein [Nocardia transvalensis]MBF6332233.1 antibiotic biosynthesis monooxygenase [Nocardia transvalensis]
MTVIVAGRLYVDPMDRDRFVEGHRPIMEAGRNQPGCIDLSISADPIEPGRVNLFEYWESPEALAAFRARGLHSAEVIDIKEDHVLKHEVSHSGPPFD